MASNNHSGNEPKGAGGRKAAEPGKTKPEWAGGLKQLYDSVVDEPIPDSFKDLLDRLDGNAMPPSDGNASEGDGEGR